MLDGLAPSFLSRVRDIRRARGVAQGDLAASCGLSRQALGAIEHGAYLPNTAVALRLARRLGCRVEDLFVVPAEDPVLPVATAGAPAGTRVVLAQVRDRRCVFPLGGPRAFVEGFAPADGVVAPGPEGGVWTSADPAQVARTAVLLGCDPAFPILARHVEWRGDGRLQPVFAPSGEALAGLLRGEAHLASAHFTDPGRDTADLGPSRHALPGGGLVVAFATWEQGLITAPGNPLGLRTVADLARPGVRLINREPGAGTRQWLVSHLAAAGIDPAQVAGFERTAPSHLAAARLVAAGAADAAVGLRAVAESLGLGFAPLGTVRSDLVLPRDLLDHPVVQTVLDLLTSRTLRRELAALPGYGTDQTGTVVLDLPSAS